MFIIYIRIKIHMLSPNNSLLCRLQTEKERHFCALLLFYVAQKDVLFSLLSLFWKNKVGLWDHVAVCVCVCVCVYPAPINFWMPEPIYMKIGITAPEPNSTD
jgi:hypothetical protein